MSVVTFRDTARQISPSWLTRWFGERLVYSIALHIDGFVHLTVLAMQMRAPGYISLGRELEMAGHDRRMPRGLVETAKNYADRLRSWRNVAIGSGNAAILLGQLQACLGGAANPLRLAIITPTQRIERDPTTGALSYTRHSWDWDGKTDLWGRFWILVYEPAKTLAPPGGKWGDGAALRVPDRGLGFASIKLAKEMQRIIAARRSAFTKCMYIIWTWDLKTFASIGPDGTWQRWGNRDTHVAYLSGE